MQGLVSHAMEELPMRQEAIIMSHDFSVFIGGMAAGFLIGLYLFDAFR